MSLEFWEVINKQTKRIRELEEALRKFPLFHFGGCRTFAGMKCSCDVEVQLNHRNSVLAQTKEEDSHE